MKAPANVFRSDEARRRLCQPLAAANRAIMSNKPIYSHWHIDIDDRFGRWESDDGFVVFEMPGRRFSCVVYEMDDAGPDEVLSKYVSRTEGDVGQFEFDLPLKQGLSGAARLIHSDNGSFLQAITATRGEVAVLRFDVAGEHDTKWALAIWRSLDYKPPMWVRSCQSANVSLVALRRAIEQDFRIDDALDDLDRQGSLSRAAPMLIEALDDDCSTVRQSACYALGQICGIDASRCALLKSLADECDLVRVRAAEALFQLGEPAAQVVPTLIEVLESTEADPLPKGEERIEGVCSYLRVPHRYYAAMALAEVGPEAASAKSALLKSLKDESGCVRVMSAEALVSQGESPSAVIPPLLEALRDPAMSKREQVSVAEALLGLGQSPKIILPTLIEAVENSDWTARADAFDILKQIGPSASPAKDAVAQAMKDSDENVRARAADTLRYIDPSQAPAGIPD